MQYNQDAVLIIFASSRPDLLEITLNSIEKFLIRRKPLKIIVNEDIVFTKQSERTVKLLKQWQQQGIIYEYYVSNSRGLGYSMDNMFNQYKYPYIINWQDDWELERPIDIEELVWIMQNNEQINQVIFNKYKNMDVLNGFKQIQYQFGYKDFCINQYWMFIPSLWRMSFVRKYWKRFDNKPEANFKRMLTQHNSTEQIGAYLYDKMYTPRYVRHIGDDYRMAKWRLQNGKPGGEAKTEDQDKRYRAHWIDYSIKIPKASEYSWK